MASALRTTLIGLALALTGAESLAQSAAESDLVSDAPSELGTTSMSAVNPLERVPDEAAPFPVTTEPALESLGGALPSLAVIGAPFTSVSVTLNGFPLDSLGHLKFEDDEPFEADYDCIAPIHPYFLRTGENKIAIDTIEDGSVAIVYWDYLHGEEHAEVVRADAPATEGAFSWDTRVGPWPWESGAAIEKNEANKKSLYTSVVALHAELNSTDDAVRLKAQLTDSTQAFIAASELRGKEYRLVDQIIEATTAGAMPGKPASSLLLSGLPPADELELEVFAGGALARLKQAADAPLFTYVSTLPDGPRGQAGGAKLAFDAWYRMSDSGEWELDALYTRLAPGTWTHFQQGPYELEDLFRLSNF